MVEDKRGCNKGVANPLLDKIRKSTETYDVALILP